MAEPFLVLGAMKSGTTSLYALLGTHPDVDVAAEKEANSFQHPMEAERVAQLIRRSAHVVAGEVSAGYMQAPEMQQPTSRVRSLLGADVRLVAVLRDPYSRAVSHWDHLTQLRRETRPIEDALLDATSPYVRYSRYMQQLRPWVDTFGQSRVHLIRLEDYSTEPAAVTAGLWKFLGVPALETVASVHENSRATRAVAVGARGRIARSHIYRSAVRPFVPKRVRRLAVGAGSGSPSSVETGSEMNGLAARFIGLVEKDLIDLGRAWPAMRWESA